MPNSINTPDATTIKKPKPHSKKQVDKLFSAVRCQDLESIRTLLSEGTPVDGLHPEQQTPLFIAVLSNHVEGVQLLLESGAGAKWADSLDLNRDYEKEFSQNRWVNNWNPAFYALDDKRLPVLELLLDHGIHPLGFSPQGYSAAVIATMLPTRGVIELLHRFGVDLTQCSHPQLGPIHPLHTNAPSSVETTAFLLSTGIPVDSINHKGYTPLMTAVERGFLPMATLFLEHGADIELKAPDGQSARSLAQKRRSEDPAIAELLVNAKLKLTLKKQLPAGSKPSSALKIRI